MEISAIEHVCEVPLNPAQKRLHDVMTSDLLLQARKFSRTKSRAELRGLRRRAIQLIQLVSNPMLLARDAPFGYDALLGEAIAEGAAPKIAMACTIARRLNREGRKCIIWTNFGRNAESIAEQLCDLGAISATMAAVLAGTFNAGVRRFVCDSCCSVLVATQFLAAAENGLRNACRDAIYVDRTYNAPIYLRSFSWIVKPDVNALRTATARVLVCPQSIDEHIQFRLREKLNRSDHDKV